MVTSFVQDDGKESLPLILTGTPIKERSELEESLVESTPGPQFATEGMTRDSSNKNSVTQFVAL